ncbi:hypothetical protein FRC08_005062 [Ceratobasidium sp. 394]|nr:hypothetical protein FRC08_005062 [Ceratobasidium sp. 394]
MCIEAGNADPEVIVGLMEFEDFNHLRIVFRLMFIIPLLALACDGIKPDWLMLLPKLPAPSIF